MYYMENRLGLDPREDSTTSGKNFLDYWLSLTIGWFSYSGLVGTRRIFWRILVKISGVT